MFIDAASDIEPKNLVQSNVGRLVTGTCKPCELTGLQKGEEKRRGGGDDRGNVGSKVSVSAIIRFNWVISSNVYVLILAVYWLFLILFLGYLVFPSSFFYSL